MSSAGLWRKGISPFTRERVQFFECISQSLHFDFHFPFHWKGVQPSHSQTVCFFVIQMACVWPLHSLLLLITRTGACSDVDSQDILLDVPVFCKMFSTAVTATVGSCSYAITLRAALKTPFSVQCNISDRLSFWVLFSIYILLPSSRHWNLSSSLSTNALPNGHNYT